MLRFGIGGSSEQYHLKMVKVVAPSSSLQTTGGSKAAPKAKRKTPSELRVRLFLSLHLAMFCPLSYWKLSLKIVHSNTLLTEQGEQLKRTAFVDQAKEAFDALRPCKRYINHHVVKFFPTYIFLTRFILAVVLRKIMGSRNKSFRRIQNT